MILFVQLDELLQERVTVGVLADGLVLLCLLLQEDEFAMEHAHALHDAQVIGIGRLDLLRQLVVVLTLAGLETLSGVVILKREVISFNLTYLIAHFLHLFVGDLLHTEVKAAPQFTLHQFLVLLRGFDGVPVKHLVTVQLQEQRSALIDVTFISRSHKPCLDAAVQFFVNFHNLLFIHV